jgi:hypothetical protein
MQYTLEESFNNCIDEKCNTKYIGQFIQYLYYYLDKLKQIDPDSIVYAYYNKNWGVLIYSYRKNNKPAHVRIKEMGEFKKYTIINDDESIDMASLFGSLIYIFDSPHIDMKNKRAILRKDDDTLFITIKQIGGVK